MMATLDELDQVTDAANAALANIEAGARAVTAQVPPVRDTAPRWWRVSMRTHSDFVINRDVTGRRPKLDDIVKHGWHEQHDDGDEYFVHADAIAVIEISGNASTPPSTALHANCINRSKR